MNKIESIEAPSVSNVANSRGHELASDADIEADFRVCVQAFVELVEKELTGWLGRDLGESRIVVEWRPFYGVKNHSTVVQVYWCLGGVYYAGWLIRRDGAFLYRGKGANILSGRGLTGASGVILKVAKTSAGLHELSLDSTRRAASGFPLVHSSDSSGDIDWEALRRGDLKKANATVWGFWPGWVGSKYDCPKAQEISLRVFQWFAVQCKSDPSQVFLVDVWHRKKTATRCTNGANAHEVVANLLTTKQVQRHAVSKEEKAGI